MRRFDLADGLIPRDVVVDGDRVLVLAQRARDGGYENRVLESRDLRRWTPLFRFTTPTFVRSFEVLDGDFYFGLGSDDDDVRPETGDILRLPAKAIGP